MIRLAIVLMMIAPPVSQAAAQERDVPAPTRALAVMTADANGAMRNARCSDYQGNPNGSWLTPQPTFFVVAEEPRIAPDAAGYARLSAGTHTALSPLTVHPGTLVNGVDLGGELERACMR